MRHCGIGRVQAVIPAFEDLDDQSLGFPLVSLTAPNGLWLYQVFPGSPAHQHGLLPGDQLLFVSSLSTQSLDRWENLRRGEEKREKWQRVSDVFSALSLKEGGWVADVGAGGGFFAFRLAQQVGPTGRVFAVDVNEETVNLLHKRAEKEGVSNIEVILGKPDDPKLPADRLDAALIVDTYHEMSENDSMLERLKEALKPDARLVVLDSFLAAPRKDSRQAQIEKHRIAPEIVEEELRKAGFQILHRDFFTVQPVAQAWY